MTRIDIAYKPIGSKQWLVNDDHVAKVIADCVDFIPGHVWSPQPVIVGEIGPMRWLCAKCGGRLTLTNDGWAYYDSRRGDA